MIGNTVYPFQKTPKRILDSGILKKRFDNGLGMTTAQSQNNQNDCVDCKNSFFHNHGEIAVKVQRSMAEFKRILIFPADPYPWLLRIPHTIRRPLLLHNHSNYVRDDNGNITQGTEEIVRAGEDIARNLRINVKAPAVEPPFSMYIGTGLHGGSSVFETTFLRI